MRTSRYPWRAAGVTAAVVAVVAAATAGCGSDDDDSGTGKSDSAALGAEKVATGSPVTVGFISEGKAAAFDTSGELDGAQAAVDYINNHLGGLQGHKIELKTCQSKGNPGTATDCANQMVSSGAVAVAEGSLGVIDQTIDVLSPAAVPLVLNFATSQKALSKPNVFSMMNGVSAVFGTPAMLAKEEGIKKVALVTIDVPAATGAANSIGKLTIGNAGAALDVVTVPPGTPDMTPQITAAKKKDPGMWIVLGETTFCGGALKAIKTASPDTTVVVNDRCIDPSIASAVPGGFEGVKVGTTSNLDPSTEDVKLFQAAIDKYKPGTKIDANSAGGWAPVVALARAVNAGSGTDVTRESVLNAIRTAPPLDYPLTNGIKFQCDGKAFPLSPNLCAASAIVTTATKEGKLTDHRILETDVSLFKPPSS